MRVIGEIADLVDREEAGAKIAPEAVLERAGGLLPGEIEDQNVRSGTNRSLIDHSTPANDSVVSSLRFRRERVVEIELLDAHARAGKGPVCSSM